MTTPSLIETKHNRPQIEWIHNEHVILSWCTFLNKRPIIDSFGKCEPLTDICNAERRWRKHQAGLTFSRVERRSQVALKDAKLKLSACSTAVSDSVALAAINMHEPVYQRGPASRRPTLSNIQFRSRIATRLRLRLSCWWHRGWRVTKSQRYDIHSWNIWQFNTTLPDVAENLVFKVRT